MVISTISTYYTDRNNPLSCEGRGNPAKVLHHARFQALGGDTGGPRRNLGIVRRGNRPPWAGETLAPQTCPGRLTGNPGGHRLLIFFLRNRDAANDLGARPLPTPDLAIPPQHPTPFIQGRQPQAAAAGIPS